MSAAGTIGGKYLPIKPLASGGMAEVALAKQVGIDGFEKLVVLKRIRPEYANDPEFVSRFLDEARIAADLRHPNVVQVYEAGRDGDGFYLAMSFVHGVAVRDLWKRLNDRGERVPLELALFIIASAARGLHYLHEKADMHGRPLGIVHRDVSPQNVLVSFEGEVKVADFGIARADNQRHATRPGHVWGKLAYMAPEQARGEIASPASDQYALAVVAWELLAGARLFEGITDAELLVAVVRAQAPPLSSRVSGFPSSLDAVIQRALAADPRDRHPSCGAFADALEAWAATNGMPASDGRLGAWLRAEMPSDSEPVVVARAPDPVMARPPAASRAPAGRRARRPARFAALALAVLFVGVVWTRVGTTDRRLERVRELQAAGRHEEAYAAAALVLRGRPDHEEARDLMAASALALETADPAEALERMRRATREHPALVDLLGVEMRVLEARVFARENVGKNFMLVDDYARRRADEPRIALAVALQSRGRITEASYLWMYRLALERGLPARQEMFDDAIEVLRGPYLPFADQVDTARWIAQTVDAHAFQAWQRNAVHNATGYELVNAATIDLQVPALLDVVSLGTGQYHAHSSSEEIIARLRILSAVDRRRVLATLRVLERDENLPSSHNRRVIREVLAALD